MDNLNHVTSNPTPAPERVGPSLRACKAFDSRETHVGKLHQIDRIKTKAAELWDELDQIVIEPGNGDAGRMMASAKTRLEEAVMWGVKGVTRA